LAHDTRWPAVGKRAISTPILGDEVLGGDGADAGDVIELGHLAGERGHRLVDPPGQLVDLGGQRIDPVEHHAQQPGVMVAEVPGQRLGQDAARD
jgi:hypothetical protein